MTSTTLPFPVQPTIAAERVGALALGLAQAEQALLEVTAGQADAVLDADGQTYLLRPAQEHLRKNEQWLQAVLAGMTDLVTVVSRGGMIVFQNAVVNRLLGFEADELVGTSIFKLMHEQDLAGLYFAFFRVIEGFESSAIVHFQHRMSNGRFRMMEAAVGRVRDASLEYVIFSMRPCLGEPGVVATPIGEGGEAGNGF